MCAIKEHETIKASVTIAKVALLVVTLVNVAILAVVLMGNTATQTKGITGAQGGPNPFTQQANANAQEQCIIGALSVGKNAEEVARLNRGCLVHNGQAF